MLFSHPLNYESDSILLGKYEDTLATELPLQNKFAHKMEKYHKVYASSGQHGFETLNHFFDLLDMDNDYVISFKDLKDFKAKHKLKIPDEELMKLIESANWHKKKLLRYQLNSDLRQGLREKDLYAALRYQKSYLRTGEVVERYKDTIDTWEMLMEAVNIKAPLPSSDLLEVKELNAQYDIMDNYNTPYHKFHNK